MCKLIDLGNFRKAIYAASLAHASHAAAELGVLDLWRVDLQQHAGVRAAAIVGKADVLAIRLGQACHDAERADLFEAMDRLNARRVELERLQAEARRFCQRDSAGGAVARAVTAGIAEVVEADVVVLDEDWGRRGRGAKIIAWINATAATADQVMERFQLARSTARNYIRRAKAASTTAKPAGRIARRGDTRSTPAALAA